MIIAKLYNILEHLIANGVPLHTEMKVGLYLEDDNGKMVVNSTDLNGLVADSSANVVYLACGDREVPFELHHTQEKPHEWETFVLMVDGSEANEQDSPLLLEHEEVKFVVDKSKAL